MRTDVEDALRRVAALGYQGVELMADTPHLWPGDVGPAQIDAVRAAIDQHGLEISNINAFMMNKVGDPRQPYWHPSWIESDSEYRRIRIDHTIAALSMAKQLGAPCITTEPGGPLEDGLTFAAGMDRFVDMLKPVIAHAEDVGVPLLIEPEPGLLIEKFDQYLELRERIDSPLMGLNFDIGHAYCVAEAPEDWVPKMAAHTQHYHAEDIAASRVHHHLVPGTGAIDFAATLKAIAATAYDGWITVELYPFVDNPDEAGAAARDHLLSVAASI